MSVQAAIHRFIDRLDGSVPDQVLHFELVRDLYSATSTPKAMVSATIAALTVIAIAGGLSGDAIYGILFAAFLMIGGARSASVWFYHRSPHDPNDIVSIRHWELGALLGAWAFAALVGLTGAYSLTFYPGTQMSRFSPVVASWATSPASHPATPVGR